MLLKLQSLLHKDQEESYYQQSPQNETKCASAEAPSPLQEWLGTFGLSGQTFQDLYNEAAASNLTSTGMSDHDRREREIQSVGCKFSTSLDHTFEALKNWIKKCIQNAAGLFTMNIETGEVAVALIVPAVKAKDCAHAEEQFARRKNVCPKVHYSDTWPAREQFWKTVFGAALVCPLGLFHWLYRIIKTLQKELFLFWPAMVDLKDCAYWVDQEDEAAVEQALCNGSLNDKKHSEDGIEELQCDNVKRKQFSDYQQKRVKPFLTIVAKLN